MPARSSFFARLARPLGLAAALSGAIGAGACTTDDDLYAGEGVKSEDGKTDSSALAVFVNASFSATFKTDNAWDTNSAIEDQLLYTIGQLNGSTSVGRLDRLELSNVRKTTSGGVTTISYDAVLPIAWGQRNNVPTKLQLKLPKDISSAAVDRFTAKYKDTCTEIGAHDVDSGSIWYYFRPARSGCTLSADDVQTITADVTPSPINTTGKFPEFDKIWEDNTFNVVAIFGKYEDGATTASDAGIAAYNSFVKSVRTEMATQGTVTSIPASIPTAPGVAVPDVEFSVTRADGKKLHVIALLSDNVRTGLMQPAFRARYEAASTRADYIVYNGHAGLGTNVRALAQYGKWVAGQYVVVFMNGCDTFAYIDDALNNAHKAVNPDDTTGMKYVDIVNNGMPAFFASMSGASMALFRGLANNADPQTYEKIFAGVDSSQVILVTGEQDNKFVPGGGGTPTTWGGVTDHATLAKNATKTYASPVLPAGKYAFDMTGTGDADLYVRIGAAPTTTSYDCRPYKDGSNESCVVTLPAPGKINVMVRGYAASSTYDLVGKKQ